MREVGKLDFISELVHILGVRLGLVEPADWTVETDTEFIDTVDKTFYWTVRVYLPKEYTGTSKGYWMWVGTTKGEVNINKTIDHYEWILTATESRRAKFTTGMYAFEAAFKAINSAQDGRSIVTSSAIERLERCLNKS